MTDKAQRHPVSQNHQKVFTRVPTPPNLDSRIMQHFLDYSSGRKHAETSFENLIDKSLCVCIDFQV